MESFWETLRDGLIVFAKATVLLLALDLALYLSDQPFSIPLIRNLLLFILDLVPFVRNLR